MTEKKKSVRVSHQIKRSSSAVADITTIVVVEAMAAVATMRCCRHRRGRQTEKQNKKL